MNRAKALLGVLFLSLMIFSFPVVAQTNQGLTWGFDPGDEYHFEFHLDAEDMQIDEEIYFNSSDALPTIPDSLDNWTDIPWVTIDAFYANGTDLGIIALIFLTALNFQLPVGNWTLMSSIYSTTLDVDHFALDAD
ncbi:MAG: hypothetical protein ACXABV_18735 [Candidatus Thorarchaeota archaeon]|jgi:hypothetical protein